MGHIKYDEEFKRNAVRLVESGQRASCSRNRVARIMRENHLAARQRRKYVITTKSDHRKASPNLLDRHFHVLKPNVAWTSDITYVETRQGWLFVATVMDLCTRKIVGLSMRADLSQELVLHALRQAIQRARWGMRVLSGFQDFGSAFAQRIAFEKTENYEGQLHTHLT